MPETITYKQFAELRDKARLAIPAFSPRLELLRRKIADAVEPYHVEMKFECGVLARERLINSIVLAVAEHQVEMGDLR